MSAAMILPGATLGMLGGGQLGRMFTVAARTLGYRVLVLDPDPGSPAGRIADQHLHAAYGDQWALQEIAQRCAAVTTEFENIPAQTLETLAQHLPVRPSAQALRHTQDRIREKQFIHATGLATAPFYPIQHPDDFAPALAQVGTPAILKRAALGYDGKGQISIRQPGELAQAFADLGEVACVLEQKLVLEREVSVIVARSADGECACYPVVENIHHHGILHLSLAPARIPETLAQQAREMAQTLAHALDYCGVMAVEFFLTASGEFLVNEIAPRPHNSGHYTLDACITSQFEQQVRAVCGLPFGDTQLLSPVVMVNILGDVWQQHSPNWAALLAEPRAKLHLYGKEQPRPGRKMGHFCVLDPCLEQALHSAEQIFARLAPS
nr:5-(carboxyamino)imidazole ribonucleotide synthase [Thiorhodospira sibirica]